MFNKTRAFSGFSVEAIDEAKQFHGETLGIDVSEENGMLVLHIHEGGDVMIYHSPPGVMPAHPSPGSQIPPGNILSVLEEG